MKKLMALFLAVLLVSTTVFATDYVDNMNFLPSDVITLEQAIELALNNDPSIVTADLNVKIQENTIKMNESKIKNLTKSHKNMDPRSLTYQKEVTNVINEQNFALDKAKREKESAVRTLKNNIENQYYTLVFSIIAEAVYEKNLADSITILKQTEQKLELGTISQQEKLNSELSKIKAENDLQNAKNTVTNAKMSFNTSLGKPVMTDVIPVLPDIAQIIKGEKKPTDILPPREFEIGSIADAITKAMSSSSNLINLKHDVDNAKFAQQYEAMGFMEGTATEIDKALNLKKSELTYQKAVSSLEVDIRKKYVDITTKKNEIIRNEKSFDNSKESFRISQVSFDAGVAVRSSVDNAQTAYLNSALSLWKSILDYNLAISAFQNAVDGF